jgi:hypothetical protein
VPFGYKKYVQNFYSFVPDSTYLSLLLDIIATHIQARVEVGYKVFVCSVHRSRPPGREPFLNGLLQLLVTVKVFTDRKSLQVQKEVKVCKGGG